MKIDPFKRRRLRGVTETKTFIDPSWPDDPITVTLASKPGTATQLSIATHAEAMVERFLAPGAMEVFIGEDDDKAPARITPEICQVIATVQILDVTPAADKYQFEEWVAIAELFPDAFAEIVIWARRLLGKTDRDDVPNDCAADTEIPSPPPLSITSPGILKWSTDGTPLSWPASDASLPSAGSSELTSPISQAI